MTDKTDVFKSANWEYSIVDDSATIIKHTGSNPDVTIPDELGGKKVTRIGKGAFYKRKRLQNITMTSSILYIDDYAFRHCRNLKSIKLSENLIHIGKFAFGGCERLLNIRIGAQISVIGENVFDCCPNLERIDVDNDNSHFCSINGHLFNKQQDLLIHYARGNTTSEYTIPESVSIILDNAFEKCYYLQKIHIPNGVIRIGEYAFKNCKSLLEVEIPISTKSVGASAFADCYSLQKVIIHDDMSCIEEGCESIKKLDITNDFIRIGACAFMGCDNLKDLYLSRNIESIDDYAFAFCENLKEVIIPDGVKRIGKAVFEDCTSLESLTIPSSVKYIGECLFGDIDEDEGEYPDTLETTIFCCRDSYAEEYANEYNIDCLCILDE